MMVDARAPSLHQHAASLLELATEIGSEPLRALAHSLDASADWLERAAASEQADHRDGHPAAAEPARGRAQAGVLPLRDVDAR